MDFMKSFSFSDDPFRWILFAEYKTLNSQINLHLLTFKLIYTESPPQSSIYLLRRQKRESLQNKIVLFSARTSFKLVFLWQLPFKNRFWMWFLILLCKFKQINSLLLSLQFSWGSFLHKDTPNVLWSWSVSWSIAQKNRFCIQSAMGLKLDTHGTEFQFLNLWARRTFYSSTVLMFLNFLWNITLSLNSCLFRSHDWHSP